MKDISIMGEKRGKIGCRAISGQGIPLLDLGIHSLGEKERNIQVC